MNEVQVLMDQFMAGHCETEKNTDGFETISVPDSESSVYMELLKHKPTNGPEKIFMASLKEAIGKSIASFKVFVNDASMDDNGKLQFIPGFKPAVGYSYSELEKIANQNSFRLGSKDEYILFLGILITNLIKEGWDEATAWFSICVDSKELGHYRNSKEAKHNFELTGSRKFGGKSDLANTRKILAKNHADVFWFASGDYNDFSNCASIASLSLYRGCDPCLCRGVGWFVF